MISGEVAARIEAAIAAAQAVAINDLDVLASIQPVPQDGWAELSIGRRFMQELGGPALSRGTLSRTDVFAVAADLPSSPTEDEVRRLVWHVNAWGYGTSARGFWRTERLVRRDGFVESAVRAIALARKRQPIEAFYFLNNAQGHVKGWGPAFFTKLLYFTDPRNRGCTSSGAGAPPAAILDRWMALVVERLVTRPPVGPFRTTGWTTPQYAFYVALMDRVARDQSSGSELITSGDVESVLFSWVRRERPRGP